MGQPLNNRNRGVILTHQGLKKLQNAKQTLENEKNQGKRYSLEQLNQITGLALRTISKIFNHKTSVDKKTLIILFHCFNLELTSNDYQQFPSDVINPAPKLTKKYQDWGEAIDVSDFNFCPNHFNNLKRWILEENCRLIMILGQVGIGKTTLSIQVAHQLSEHFDYIIFRSLYHAPTLERFLSEIIHFLSQGQENQADFKRLLHYLRRSRCLLILDNLDAILAEQQLAGKYRENYESYSKFLQIMGETKHQSCLMITSREKTREVAILEDLNPKVRSLNLSGCAAVCLSLFNAKNLSGSPIEQEELAQRYHHNPLALKIIYTSIKDLFAGEITAFLNEQNAMFGIISEFFDQQFNRLSSLEQTIIYWLAINRTWTTITDLQRDIIPHTSKPNLLAAIESLKWRSLLEINQSSFTVSSLFMDYVSDRFIQQIITEIIESTPDFNQFQLLKSHLLINDNQTHPQEPEKKFIIQSCINKLITIFSSVNLVEKHLKKNKIIRNKIMFLTAEKYLIKNINYLLFYINNYAKQSALKK